MDNYLDNEIFSFDDELEKNENLEQATPNFNYNSISGLGESDYENDDLFNESAQSQDTISYEGNLEANNNVDEEIFQNVEVPIENQFKDENIYTYDEEIFSPINGNQEIEEEMVETPIELAEEKNVEPLTENLEDEESPAEIEEDKVEMSDTSIEDLNKLTEYKEEEKVETTNIADLFDRVSVNVKEASDIFRKNSEMKEKIDTRFEELKNLQSEIEKSKKSQIDEIDSYKAEVLSKLNEKKNEIEKRLNTLKEVQSSLETNKKEFEEYKKSEIEKIEKIQKDVQTAYDERREELNHIEDVLRKQKDALDEERNQLSLDRIQYESDKNELANNLLKFNELVDSFTNGVSEVKEVQE